MTERQSSLELVHSAEQAATEPLRHDVPTRSLPEAAPKTDPAALHATPKTWLGVIVACVLGVVPLVVLVLVREQDTAPGVPATPLELVEPVTAPTPVSELSAPVEAEPIVAAAEPGVIDAPFEPSVQPAAALPIARVKSTGTGSNGAPAPVRRSWFHR